jgi:hypothetical protein
MALLVVATYRGTVLEQVARTSRTMRIKKRCPRQTFLSLPNTLIAMGTSPA